MKVFYFFSNLVIILLCSKTLIKIFLVLLIEIDLGNVIVLTKMITDLCILLTSVCCVINIIGLYFS